MAPRRGGSGGAGVDVALSGTGGKMYFEPPPLKRMQPWAQDGSGQCDILAGGVDETGIFKGVYMSSVHLAALLRTFQLSKVFMPVDVPQPVAALGKSLEDGTPIIVVTRGVFGRELDYGPGPVRNDVQKSIWSMARDMRAEMPQVLITCIDVPINLGAEVIQSCLEPPLNDYRELMYQDGTWYTPALINAQSLGKWMLENPKVPSAPAPTDGKGKSTGQMFNRKSFAWTDTAKFYADMFVIGWREVLQVSSPPVVPRRTDLVFTTVPTDVSSKPIKREPTAAAANFKKALAVAKESGDSKKMLAAAAAYAEKATVSWKDLKEKLALAEAIKICDEASEALKREPKDAFEATKLKVKILIAESEVSEALKVATAAKSGAADGSLEAAALKLILDCHYARGDLDEAVKAAAAGKGDVAKKGNAEATTAASELVVDAYLAKGDADGAIKAAEEAATAKDQKCAGKGWLMVARAQMAKAAEAGVGDGTPAASYKKAAAAFKQAGDVQLQADALDAAVSALLEAGSFTEALATAKELQVLGKGDAVEAAGKRAVAAVCAANFLASSQHLEGGSDAMLSAAKDAAAFFENLGDSAAKGKSQRVLAEALLAAGAPAEQVIKAWQAAVATFKKLGDGAGTVAALIGSARAKLHCHKQYSAYWDAKQAVMESGQASGEALELMESITYMLQETGKPHNVGPPVY